MLLWHHWDVINDHYITNGIVLLIVGVISKATMSQIGCYFNIYQSAEDQLIYWLHTIRKREETHSWKLLNGIQGMPQYRYGFMGSEFNSQRIEIDKQSIAIKCYHVIGQCYINIIYKMQFNSEISTIYIL